MPGYWDSIFKTWEATVSERYDDAEVRILKSRKRCVEAQNDLTETAARLQGKAKAAWYKAEAEVLEAHSSMLDVQARLLVKKMEIQQLLTGAVPPRLAGGATKAIAAAPAAIEPYSGDREVESLAQQIAHKLASMLIWERDEAWEEIRAGLRRDVEPLAAKEVERRAQAILKMLGK